MESPARFESLHMTGQGVLLEIQHLLVDAEQWPDLPESSSPEWAHFRKGSIIIAWRVRS